MNLSPHFTLSEASKSQVALRLGIDNTPPPTVIPKLRLVAETILEPCRAKFKKPFSPSSWYRCPELNRAIGSKLTSQHVQGEAVDFEIPGVSNLDVARFIRDELLFDQLILEFFDGSPDSGWVHCSFTDPYTRNDVLVFDGKRFSAGLPA